MINSIVRCDKWQLKPTQEQVVLLERTQREYRKLVRALIGVIYTHYPQIVGSNSTCAVIERLIHCTKKNPNPKYDYFRHQFYKFPSYLRRAAIEFAYGQVSSFVTRYQRWQSGIRSRRDARPPQLNGVTNTYPALYRGQCIKFDLDYTQAEIKVFTGTDWIWTTVPISLKRERHKIQTNKQLSPYLMVERGHVLLAVAFKSKPKQQKLNGKLLSVDVGINTTATATVVCSDGTVTSRRFIHRGADIDRRDKRLKTIGHKARLTMGKSGKLSKGFCQKIYRKCHNINREIAQKVSRELVDMAVHNGCAVIVFEDLKNWRPKAGRKRSNLKQRFHGWLHRLLVKLTTEKFEELGGRIELVDRRGTSSVAYDGTGSVKRSKTNYADAVFTSGKRYSADLNGAYNIGARYWAYVLKLSYRNGRQLTRGKSTSGKQRMPVTLSILWEVVEATNQCGA